jgi:hypothetical protein
MALHGAPVLATVVDGEACGPVVVLTASGEGKLF